jgi:hypothetical protein
MLRFSTLHSVLFTANDLASDITMHGMHAPRQPSRCWIYDCGDAGWERAAKYRVGLDYIACHLVCELRREF